MPINNENRKNTVNSRNLCIRLGISRDMLPNKVYDLMTNEKALYAYLMSKKDLPDVDYNVELFTLTKKV